MAINSHLPSAVIRRMNQKEWDIESVISWLFEDGRLIADLIGGLFAINFQLIM